MCTIWTLGTSGRVAGELVAGIGHADWWVFNLVKGVGAWLMGKGTVDI